MHFAFANIPVSSSELNATRIMILINIQSRHMPPARANVQTVPYKIALSRLRARWWRRRRLEAKTPISRRPRDALATDKQVSLIRLKLLGRHARQQVPYNKRMHIYMGSLVGNKCLPVAPRY